VVRFHSERRLRTFCAAQSVLARQPALLLFDEVEDVFNDADGFFGRRRPRPPPVPAPAAAARAPAGAAAAVT
jgi:hypothetical protein